MQAAVIVEAVRTPFGRRNGSLSSMHPVDLSAHVLNALVERAGIAPETVEDVIWGCVSQIGDQSSNVGRYAVLAAGWPEGTPGVTINRACGSSQQSLDFAAMAIMSGQYEVIVAGGVESMSRVPLGAARVSGVPFGPKATGRYNASTFSQGLGAEMVAERWNLDREELDRYATSSHERAALAIDSGAFDRQIVPVPVEERLFTVDEGVRRGTSIETLSKLKPSFQTDGVIHAGNASQISDGASALLLMSEEKARQMGLKPIVRYHTGVVTGSDPVMMLTGPIAATHLLLKKAGVGIGDIGVYEVNEAFAPVPLAWLAETNGDPQKMNPLGGAIALGHPLGASGAGLMTRMIHHMRDRSIQYGLQTMCEGGGTANATLVELVN